MPVLITFLLGLGALIFFAGRAEARELPESTLLQDYEDARRSGDYIFILGVAERLEAAGDMTRAIELRKHVLRVIGGAEGRTLVDDQGNVIEEQPTFWVDALNAMPLFLQENMIAQLFTGNPTRIRVVAAQARNEGFPEIADALVQVAVNLEQAGTGNGVQVFPLPQPNPQTSP